MAVISQHFSALIVVACALTRSLAAGPSDEILGAAQSDFAWPFLPFGSPSSPAPPGHGEQKGVKVCGNYCGPGWCAGQFQSENVCDASVPPEEFSCPDACCREHDICCGTTHLSPCNRAIVDCLKKCGDLDLSCTNGFIPVPAGAIENTMGVVEDWCCGHPCEKQVYFV
eukprot:CAMPEP_0177251010 /NCGR_PEP_ID=MMETSP0367-20130122/53714_1 /TAXON_ID=447022 ORGANISM="Scrippsiella hangoei-like, Strain SHHI-4" /NCGR_SAMPLE_ID=MMETSP0367 /ASSEMBLY_ACC=CAM_ASM_000362 /LENGTH=168 /DNA_ID=CAMNT_0018703867 /DNA_START=51 /DNA_END=557 /DNA_ORIENTATION=-